MKRWVFVIGTMMGIATSAWALDDTGGKSLIPFVFARSTTFQSLKPLPFEGAGASILSHMHRMGEGLALLPHAPMDMSRYAEEPTTYDIQGESVQVYPRRENDVLFEDAYVAIYKRPGHPARTFYKGTAGITRVPRKLDFDEALRKAKATIQFDEIRDVDHSLEQDHVMTYRYHERTQLFHSVFTCLFYVARVQEFVETKVDAHTGEVIALYPLHSRTILGSEVPTLDPKSKMMSVPLSGLVVTTKDAEGTEIMYRSDETGAIDFQSEDFAQIVLAFQNAAFAVGKSKEAGTALPHEPYQKSFDGKTFWDAHTNLSQLLDMTTVLPFYYFQKALTLAQKEITEAASPYALPVVTDFADPDSTCNAYYGYEVKAGKKILRPSHFVFYRAEAGQCRAAAESPSIVLHEFGHYLDFRTGGITDSASSEGFGDILSMLYLKSPKIGAHFKFHDHNHYIRDLRVDRAYPLHRGEVHFEGEILGSAFWDLIVALHSIYNPTWVYETLTTLFLKSLMVASHMQDIPRVISMLLAKDPSVASPNHLQCMIHSVFAKHGLEKPLPKCQENQPQITIGGSATGNPLHGGDEIPVSVTLNMPGDTFVPEAYVVGSLWVDDDMVSQRVEKVAALLPGPNDFVNLFRFSVPTSVSKDHRYVVRVGYTDRVKSVAIAEQEIMVDRTFLGLKRFSARPQKLVEAGEHTFPIQIASNGFVGGDVRIKVGLSSEDDTVPITLYVETKAGHRVRLAITPPSLKGVSNQWMSVSPLFQGLPAKDIRTLGLVHREPLAKPIRVESYEVEVPVYAIAE